MISEKEFLALCKKGNLIPIFKEILGDLDTPVSTYMKLAKKSKYSFLLESVEGEEKVSRFSFIASNPELIFQSTGRTAEIQTFVKGRARKERKPITDSPLTFVREIMKKYRFVEVPGLPSFCGGMVGYLSYDTVKFFERLPQNTRKDVQIPDTLLVLAKDLVIFDHRNHSIKILKCVSVDPEMDRETKLQIYRGAIHAIDQTISALKRPLAIPANKRGQTGQKRIELSFKSNFTAEKFKDIVLRAKREIRAGEIIQVVLSQRFQVDLDVDPVHVYRALRSLNPSPYMYYLNFDGVQIVGSSPELLVRCENGVVETRPIAGTRPRGRNEKEDNAFAQELLNDPKERAEHVMLVDLGRNDLGRVCKKGTVKVSEFMNIEKYSHVMHIVSNVQGKLRPDKDGFDVLASAFPAGTLSGAPKIRAMEIIEDLEDVSRGPYGGCIGYFSFSGNLDTCITIRTIVVADGQAYIQAGAGIVADSKPQKEYEETCNKAGAQLKAIEIAQNLGR